MQFWQSFGLLAEEAAKQEQGPGAASLLMFMPFIIIIFLFYLIIWRPQKKNEERRRDMVRAIKKNDKVVTVGGIVGTVANMTERFVTLKMDDGSRIKLLRTHLGGLLDERAFEEDKPSPSSEEESDDHNND